MYLLLTLSALAFLVSLLLPLSNALSLRISEALDNRNCPFPAKATPLSDSSGFTLTYNTKGTSLASIGPSVPKTENMKTCYIYLDFEISENQRISVDSINLESPAKFSDGVQAAVKTDFVWAFETNWLQTTAITKDGPVEGDLQANYTDDPRTYQSACRYTGPTQENNTNPFSQGVHIRTHFNLTGLGDAAGELGKDTTVTQTIKFKYDKPCDLYHQDDEHQICMIDREGYYLCACGKEGRKQSEDPMEKFGPCEKWIRFPPDPMVN